MPTSPVWERCQIEVEDFLLRVDQEKWAEENSVKLNKTKVSSCIWDGLRSFNNKIRVPALHRVQFCASSCLQERSGHTGTNLLEDH